MKWFRLCLLLQFVMAGHSFGECRHAVDVSCGENHSLVLIHNGSLWACGYNGDLVLGVGSSVMGSNSPVQVKGEDGIDYLSNIVCFDAGWYHSLACDNTGTLWAWGTDSKGQIGNGSGGNSEYPQKVLGLNGSSYLQDIVYVSAGRSGQHSLAIDSDGYAYSWGFNSNGQCGNGNNTDQQVPVRVITDSDNLLDNIVAVNAGVSHSLALASDGRVWEFGDNNNSNKAKLVQNQDGSGYLENIVAIATCDNSLAVDSFGHVWFWSTGYPSQVSGLQNIIDVSLGHTYYLAIDSDGYLWKWESGVTPYKVAGGEMNTSSGYLEDIIAADAGYFEFELAVDTYGNVWGFGSNTYGQLGVGDTTDRDDPALAECVSGTLLLDLDQTPKDICIAPEDEVTATVCVTNDLVDTYEDVYIVLYLDKGFTYPDGDWYIDGNMQPYQPDPRYDEETHSIVYYIGSNGSGTIQPGEQSCETFTLTVNENAVSGMELVNTVELYQTICTVIPDPDDPNDPSKATTICEDVFLELDSETMPVCCWDSSTILYVSENATGANTGNSWPDAYNTEYGLKKALERATYSTCNGPFTIYVAQGTYLPGVTEDESFDIPDSTEVYGGFPPKGCNFANRNPKKYNSILNGKLGDYDFAYSVVNMGNETWLEGVTVKYGYDYNIYGAGVDFTVNNSIIENGLGYGIMAEYGNVVIKTCMISNNHADGIYHGGIAQDINISNSWIMRNDRSGIICEYTTPIIKNSIISESDLSEEGRAGIYIHNPASSPILHNNTISNNKSVGIHFEDDQGSNPNIMFLDYPDIQNCIIYFNNNNGQQLDGRINPSFASYSCIQDCNDVNPNNNINTIPMFAYPIDPLGTPDPNNYHLAYNSACKDMGNPNLDYSYQLDYDNESRIADDNVNIVDIGADELYSCNGNYTEDEFANENDWNADGIVNLEEFKLFAKSWLALDPGNPAWSDPNYGDPNDTIAWNSLCNLDDTGSSQYSIDLADLTVFVNDVPWLWKACWYDNYTAAQAASQMAITSTSVAPLESVANVTALSLDAEADMSQNVYESMTNSELAEIVSGIYSIQDQVEGILQDCKVKDKKDLQNILDFFDDELVIIKEALQ